LPNSLNVERYSVQVSTLAFLSFLKKLIRAKSKILVVLLILFPFIIFPLSYKTAITAFENIRIKNISNVVYLCLKEEAKQNYCQEFLNANENNELYVITSTKDKIFVIHQPVLSGVLKRGYTYEIQKNDILATKIRLKDFALKPVEK